MNAVPKRLKKEPLIEAIWQIQFEPQPGLPAGDLLPGILFPELKNDHHDLKLSRLPTADIPAPLMQVDPNLKFAAKYRMDQSGSPFVFQVGDRVLTVNCRRPYAGWHAFKEQVFKVISITEKSNLVPQPLRHSLRYLDLIDLDPAPDLSALQLALRIGGQEIQNRPIRLRVELPDEGCMHVVQVGTPTQINLPEGPRTGTMLDIETSSTEESPDWTAVREQTDILHAKSKAIFFEKLLTANATARLEPEY